MTHDSGQASEETSGLEPKAPRASAVTLSQPMELRHANLMGNVHGGEIMKLIDSAAGIAASRHAGGVVVTASLDQMSFLHPVHVGNVVFVHASVNDVGRTSMEVGVRVEAEDVVSGRRTHTSSAYLVFVALDEHGRPRPVLLLAVGLAEVLGVVPALLAAALLAGADLVLEYGRLALVEPTVVVLLTAAFVLAVRAPWRPSPWAGA